MLVTCKREGRVLPSAQRAGVVGFSEENDERERSVSNFKTPLGYVHDLFEC